MRRSLFIIVAAVFIIQIYYSESFAYQKEIGTLTSAIARNMDKVGRKRVAVTDFTDSKGNITDLGRYLADEISSSLKGEAKGFEVLERAQPRGRVKRRCEAQVPGMMVAGSALAR